VAALRAGSVQGVIGDSLVLASLAGPQSGPAFALTPEEPYERFAVACVLPENDSAFRNLVNLAIARLLQGYLDGTPAAVAAIDPWIGPGSSLNLPADLIRTYFESVLLGVEALRPLPPAAAPSGAQQPGS
jgi:polar amino acid transport system substrate-binding protein